MPTSIAATIGIDQEIKTRGDEFTKAWNNHDPKAMAALWLNDGDVISPFGRWAKGRSEVEKLFREEHTTFMKNSTTTMECKDIRTFGPDLVLSEWEQHLRNVETGDPNRTSIRVHVTLLLQRQGGTWYTAAARPVIYIQEPGKNR